MNKIVILITSTLLFYGCGDGKKSNHKERWEYSHTLLLDGISPVGIVSQDEFLWLSDVDNNRIVKTDSKGKIIEKYSGFKRPMHIAIRESEIYVPEYATDSIKILNSGKISFYPLPVQADAIAGVGISGTTIAVADFYNNRIILQQDGKVTIIGKEGHKDGELYYPTDVEIRNEMVYVADAYNNRVQVFDFKGNFIKMIGTKDHINVATGIKVTDKYIVIADFEGNRILIYNNLGELPQILADHLDKPTDIEIVKNKMYITNYRGKSISVFKLIQNKKSR